MPMEHVEYAYSVANDWQALAAKAYRLSPLSAPIDLLHQLSDQGYRILSQSRRGGDCGVGDFVVWGLPTPDTQLPRYAIEIEQMDAEGVVWIRDLPALWEFLRLYGQVGLMMVNPFLGEEEETDGEEVICDDCRKELELGLTPGAHLHVVPPPELN
jgi:hypothetical protein